jgi:hypothetical protein
MPAANKDTLYIVSRVVATALKAEGRTIDILVPDQYVRDANDKVIGIKGFAKY